jgi:hypothetical protein
MSPHRFAACAVLACLTAAPAVLCQDQPTPTLKGLVVSRLEKLAELRRAGVKIADATYARGVVRITGSAPSEALRDRVREEVEAIRRVIEETLDIRVKEVDVTGVTVREKLPPPTGEKPKDEKPRPGSEKPKPEPDSTLIGEEWFYLGVVDFGWGAPAWGPDCGSCWPAPAATPGFAPWGGGWFWYGW